VTTLVRIQLPAWWALFASMALACGAEGEHPPPIGGGGRGQPIPPVIVEGGSNSGGTPGQAGSISTAGSVDAFAGSSGDTSLGGTSFAGDVTTGGSTSTGDGLAGTANGNFSGSFTTGGI